MIQFQQVSKIYSAGKPALQNINFTLKKGEMVFITGPSGAGKSTLLKLVCGFERSNDGRILFNNIDIGRLPKKFHPFLRRRLGIVFQDHQLLMDHSVYHNVALPLIILGKSKEEIQRKVMVALERVGLYDKMRYYPIQLSGGEQQRVGIARAIVNKPLVILADEPTGNLDEKIAREIFTLFEEFNRIGVTVIIATHNVSLIKPKYRVLTLNNGRLIRDGYGKSK